MALAFDARNHGESGGEPRHYESIKMKIEDVKASIDFLVSLPNVDEKKIMLLGICQVCFVESAERSTEFIGREYGTWSGRS